ncbi:MAG: hypothetical protein WEB58_19655 [Planctomycetaceae bacterium]
MNRNLSNLMVFSMPPDLTMVTILGTDDRLKGVVRSPAASFDGIENAVLFKIEACTCDSKFL